MNKCRDCKYWYSIPPWQGNCKLHPTSKPQWSADATPVEKRCPSFTPTYIPDPNRSGCLMKARD